MKKDNSKSGFQTWKRLTALALAVLLLVSSDSVASLPTVLASGDPAAQSENAGGTSNNKTEQQTEGAAWTEVKETSATESPQQSPSTEQKTTESEPASAAGQNTTESETASGSEQKTTESETASGTEQKMTESETVSGTEQEITESEPVTEVQITEKQTESEKVTERQSETEKSTEGTEKETKKVRNTLKSAPRANDTGGFELSAAVSNTTVIAGGTLNYHLEYTVPGGGSFNRPTLSIKLPRGVKQVQRNGGDDIYQEQTLNGSDGSTTIIYLLRNELDTGKSNSIDLSLSVENFIYENGTELKLPVKFSVEYIQNGSSEKQQVDIDKEAAFKVEADDGWNVKKERVGDPVLTSDGDFYDITYRMTVYNQSASAYASNPEQESDWNRLGRLDMLADSFSLTDILPVNVPEGGDAVSIQSVKVSSVLDEAGRELNPGSEYTVNTKNGGKAVESVTIKYLQQLTAEKAPSYPNVKAGTPIKTVYTVVVRYPRAPYVTPSDEELRTYELTNEAQLKYQLIGQTAQLKKDTAKAVLGEQEKPGAGSIITVKKYIRFEGEEAIALEGKLLEQYFGTGAETISFGLFKEEECITRANDIEGKVIGDKKLGEDGTVTFDNLKPGRTYYLKETVMNNEGFSGITQSCVPVSVNEDGSVTVGSYSGDGEVSYDTEKKIIQVINIAKDVSVVQFEKKGFGPSGEIEKLTGVSFKLYNDKNSYEAVSDENGLVRFENVLSGVYKLKETGVGDNHDYSVFTDEIEVKVEGGKFVVPDLKETGADENGVFLNTSQKGLLKILKVDSQKNSAGEDIPISGVRFKLYGPYAASAEKPGKDDVPVQIEGQDYIMTTGDDGVAVSVPLEEGKYFVEEIETNEQYVLLPGLTEVTVKANTAAENVRIENIRKITVTLNKKGKLGNSAFTEQLAGAVYAVYGSQSDAEEDRNRIGTLTTILDSGNLSTSNEIYLENHKEYWYKEIEAPKGYKLDGTVKKLELDLIDGKNQYVIEESDIAEYGQIKIIKEDASDSSIKLEGAEFEIYEDEACSKKAWDGVLTTDENGEARSPILPVGKYYIKETKAPENYIKQIEVVKGLADGYGIDTGDGIELSENVQTVVKIKNNPFISLVIMKTDSVKNSPVRGAGFTLYTEEGCADSSKVSDEKFTDGSEGKVTFDQLEPGRTYYLKETTVPSGYVSDGASAAMEITMPEIGDSKLENLKYIFQAENDRKGKIVLNKKSNMDQEEGKTVPLAGAEFELYAKATSESPDSIGQLSEKVGETKTTDADGYIEWDDLVPGTYWLAETKAEGHKISGKPQKIVVTAGMNQDGYNKEVVTEILNEADQGKVEIEKVDKADPEIKLEGVTFQIYVKKEDGHDYSEDASVGQLVTDSEGKAVSGWLDEGEYVLIEQSTGKDNADYELDKTPVPFTIVKARTTALTGSQAITNRKRGKLFVNKYGKFSVKKSDGTETGEDVYYGLSGASIEVYKKYSEDKMDDIKNHPPIITIDSMPQSWSSELLPAGSYWVVETKAPDGYNLNSDEKNNIYPVEVVSGRVDADKDAGNVVDINNESEDGRIKVIKKSNSGVLLEGAEFEVYQETEAAEADETAVIGGATVYLKKVKVSASSDEGGFMLQTNENGEAVTIILAPGTYYLKETKAPDGYFSETVWTIVTVEEGKETAAEVINFKENALEGKKQDGAGNGIPGAYFGLFANENDAKTAVQYLESKNAAIDLEARLAIKKMLDEQKYKGEPALQNMLQYAVSDANGAISFHNIAPGDYWVVELVAPMGKNFAYDYDETLIRKVTVTVKEDGTVEGTFAFVDKKMGRLQVSKVTNLSTDIEYRVQGVKFHVYKAVSDPDPDNESFEFGGSYYKAGGLTASGFTNEYGIYESILLPEGLYIVKEATKEEYGDAALPIAVDPDKLGKENQGFIFEVKSGETNLATVAKEQSSDLLDTHKFTNTAAAGKFILKKVDQKGEPLRDATATFKVQVKENGEYKDYMPDGKTVYEFTASKNRADNYIYTSDFLPVGDYRLVETKCTNDYTLSEPVEFSIAAGGLTGMDPDKNIITAAVADQPIIITNIKKGKFILKKVGVYTGTESNEIGEDDTEEIVRVMPGVRFLFYKRTPGNTTDPGKDNVNVDGSNTDPAKGYVDAANTRKPPQGELGTIDSGWLDAGDYWIYELSIDEDENPEFSIESQPDSVRYIPITIRPGEILNLTDSGDDPQGSVKNITDWGKFKIKKTDSVNSDNALAGAVFKVYTQSKDTQGSYDAFMLNGSAVTLKTGADGTAVSALLPPGEYYLQEETAPQGYLKNTTYYGPYVVEKNGFNDYSSTPVTNDRELKVQVNKTGFSMEEKKDVPLKDVTFGLYLDRETAVNDKDGEKAAAKAVTNGQGVAVFSGRNIKEFGDTATSGTYYLKELSAPEHYVMNTEVYEVPVSYQGNSTDSVVFKLDQTVNNPHEGRFTIKKQTQWKDINDENKRPVALEAVFDVYKVNDRGEHHAEGQAVVQTLSTKIRDITDPWTTASSKYLEEGWYEIVEHEIDGYALAEPVWIQVKNNTTASEFYRESGDAVPMPIQNTADKGKFILKKMDGSGTTPLTGAEFRLERYDEQSGQWVKVWGGSENEENPEEGKIVVRETEGYESGMLKAGKYRLIEIKAPVYQIPDTSDVIEFALDSTPVDLTIAEGETAHCVIRNNPKGTIRFTKKGVQTGEDGKDIQATMQNLSGAVFKLYTKNSDGTYSETGRTFEDKGNGVYELTNVDPGTYYIHEISAPEGYGINTGYFEVTVETGKSVSDPLIYEPVTDQGGGVILDRADSGRILIKKTDADSSEKLNGAVFNIYSEDGELADTVTIEEGGMNVSRLLPAAIGGTTYKIREIKAPAGYTLDKSWYPVEQKITVYPVFEPTAENGVNYIEFKNKKITADFGSFLKDIKKTVSDEDEAGKTSVKAEESLLEEAYTTDFTLGGYADGKNNLPASEFTVTDNKIVLQYNKSTAEGIYDYADMDPKLLSREDYQVNEVILYPASNKDTAQKVKALVEYQVYGSEAWREYNGGQQYELTKQHTLSFAGINSAVTTVTGVRVRYLNVQKGFKLADAEKGITMNVTFNKRDGMTGPEMPEIRRILNTAHIDVKEVYKDNNGMDQIRQAFSIDSNTVEALIPSYAEKLPTVSLTNVVTNSAGSNRFAAGATVAYKVTASNVQDSEADFIAPIVTFDLAPYTFLNTNFGTAGVNGQRGFRVMRRTVQPDGSVVQSEIPASDYEIIEDKDTPFIGEADAGGQILPSELKTTRYAFKFSDGVVLKPGEDIVIELQAIIDYTKPSGEIKFDSPSYLGSSHTVLPTLENPNGTSFVSKSAIVNNPQVDETVQEGPKDYISESVVVYTIDSTGLKIQKSISADDVNFSMVNTAYVNPTDMIYYNVTMYNFSDVPAKTARIVDILPFNGDSYIINSNAGRYTNIPYGSGYEKMSFRSMDVFYSEGADNIEKVTYYYYVEDSADANSWKTDKANAMASMGMLYGVNSTDGTANSYEAWTGRWQTTLPDDLSKVTAVGAEVTFKQAALLDKNNFVNLHIAMKTPGYTAAEIEDYAGRQMVNAAAGSVVRAQDDGIVADMGLADRVESNEVIAKLNLPTGTIGDQLFYDHNKNGIQDLGEGGADTAAGEGLKVKLYQRTTSTVTGDGQEILYATTTTDGNGKYLFTDLPCNYLKKDATDDLDDPNNYVGGEFYEYRVEFEAPEGFGFTQKGAGNDREKDSDANADGFSDYIRLNISYDPDTKELTGQKDLSLDAGFIKPYELGNRVWLDVNRDGLQNTYIDEATKQEITEPGVANVGVKLYRVDGEDGVIQDLEHPYRTTMTDANGEYWFRNLPEGYYVVVFDISHLRKEDGYSYQYAFTDENVKGDSMEDLDSDAMESSELNEDQEDRIRKTKVVHLSYDAMKEILPDPYSDDRWDAGLTVYSAIGGFCFDDENYTDMQDLYIPLPGTQVELYRVTGGVREEEPYRYTTVGEDGRYFFDKLIEGQYQIHFKFPEGYTAVQHWVGTNTTDSDVTKFENGDRTQGYTVYINLGRDTVDRTWDAGAYKLSSIGDYVWFDENKNGIQDPGEKGIGGIKVILQSRMDGGEWGYESDTKTDADGKYIFTNLKSSKKYGKQYRVVFKFDEGTSVTTSIAGDDRGLDSDAIFKVSGLGWVTMPIPILDYGTSDMTWDAGIVDTKGTIGDFVWYDKNRNGIQDEGEKGLEGIKVVLEVNTTGDMNNEDAWTEYGATETNSSGYYRFYDLPSGYYRVRFQIPEEYRITLFNQGESEELDSDASRAGADRWFYSRGFYLNVNVKPVDLSWDAGVYKISDTETIIIDKEPGDTIIKRPDVYEHVTNKITKNVIRTVRRSTTRVVRRPVNKVVRRASKTDDPTDIWLWLILMAASGAVVLLSVRKRRAKS